MQTDARPAGALTVDLGLLGRMTHPPSSFALATLARAVIAIAAANIIIFILPPEGACIDLPAHPIMINFYADA